MLYDSSKHNNACFRASSAFPRVDFPFLDFFFFIVCSSVLQRMLLPFTTTNRALLYADMNPPSKNVSDDDKSRLILSELHSSSARLAPLIC